MLKKRIAAMGFGAVASIAAPFVAYHEGKEQVAYKDPVGVVTICHGHTATARIGQYKTEQECLELLKKDLAWTYDALERHVKVPITENQAVALSSFVFNFGEPAFRKSTMLRKLNAGNTKAACDELLRWINAGGKPMHGLVIRRADERALCLSGL